MGGYTVGLDVGSSSIKASILDIETGKVVGSYTSPSDGKELAIVAPEKGWAQQDPRTWEANSKLAVRGAIANAEIDGDDIEAIGVSYQMHGMTPVSSTGDHLMDAIIWCDGRTTKQKESAEKHRGVERRFLNQTLNLPGHFTASKLAWFKENKPELYQQLDKALLPGHYLLRRLTGESTVTASGLSEGVLWDFNTMGLSRIVMDHFKLDPSHIPDIKPTFGEHGRLTRESAQEWGVKEGTPMTYFAGDQPNNAFSLNVLEPGEIAAVAGTSAVLYGISEHAQFDAFTRVNSFLHVNSSTADHSNLRVGILGCINGAGISNRYFKDVLGGGSYNQMNEAAASVNDTDGLIYIPFGNGPERSQQDANTGSHLVNLDLNRHTEAHIYRAVQEGIAYAMKYCAEVMGEMGMPIEKVRAGHGNMFLSPVFRQAFADALQAPVELYDTDGAAGAARGAAVGLGRHDLKTAFTGLEALDVVEPGKNKDAQYKAWTKAVQHMNK